jgi:TRAP transporter TAXI family solute receptor
MPVPADDNLEREARLDKLLAEYLRRRDAGETIDRRAFLEQHADLAEELRDLLDTAELVDCMAGPIEVEPQPDDTPTQPDPAPGPRPPQETTAFDPNVTAELELGSVLPLDSAELTISVAEFSPSEEAPCLFGDYELLKTLGRGGMGVVYKARQVSLDRIVALKMILSGRFASEADIRRFYAEAQAAGKLGHPHIVNVYEMDQVDGRHYFTMEFVEGRTLAEVIGGKPLPPERTARYLELIARAIQCAHDHGVLHRDLKPANVLIDERDEPQVTDFGLAKDMADKARYTASGAAIGTPGYMAPEQAAGRQRDIGVAADVYSLGAILYEMLTGRPPFSGDSVVDIILDVIHKNPLPPHVVNPQVDPELEVVCLKCLRKTPSDRYASAQDVADEMRRYLEGQPIRARPLSAARRTALWVRDVPLVSAMLGRKVFAPTPWQVRAQWLALAVLMFVAAAVTAWLLREKPLPPQIRIASGGAGGMYHRVSQALAEHLEEQTGRPATVLETAGSYANREMLERGNAELGLLQSDALTSPALAVATPLYYEVVLVVARRDRGIQSISDLQGRAVALGRSGSGMRNTALTVLHHYGIDGARLARSESVYAELLTNEELDGALIITGYDSDPLKRLMAEPDLMLLPMERSLQIADAEPSLKATRITPETAPEFLRDKIPAHGLPTLKTPAFLTVRADASPKLVRAVLGVIYRQSDLTEREGLIPLEQAARWPLLPLHPAAAEFFRNAGNSAAK